jgi:hypothetical protein
MDMARLPEKEGFPFVRRLFGNRSGKELEQAVSAYALELYSETRLTDMEKALELVGKSVGELLDLNDPMLNFVAGLVPDLEWFASWHGQFSGEVGRINSHYLDLVQLWKKEAFYPDSDLTLRLTYGSVQGYSPREAVEYKPFTTLTGLMDKHIGQEPFDVPQKLRDLYAARDFGKYSSSPLGGQVPVSFLSDLDVIGGSSGSPVLNSRGDVVGLVYDRCYEAMIAEFVYLPDVNRTMAVDVRFVLFLTDKSAGLNYLLDEMELR